MISRCLGHANNPIVSIHMLVTSTPDGPVTHIHSKTCYPTNTIPPTNPTTTSITDNVNASAPLTEG